MRILHLAPELKWRQAAKDGAYRGSTRGAELSQVGYVHASTSSQLPGVVDAVYEGEPLDDQVLLVVDLASCEAAGSAVRWEVPDDADEPFPHVCGPIPVRAVVAALPVTRGANGALVLPDLTGLDVLDHPRSAETK